MNAYICSSDDRTLLVHAPTLNQATALAAQHLGVRMLEVVTFLGEANPQYQ